MGKKLSLISNFFRVRGGTRRKMNQNVLRSCGALEGSDVNFAKQCDTERTDKTVSVNDSLNKKSLSFPKRLKKRRQRQQTMFQKVNATHDDLFSFRSLRQ